MGSPIEVGTLISPRHPLALAGTPDGHTLHVANDVHYAVAIISLKG